MTKRIEEYPHGTLIRCDACGHVCNRDYSEFPPDNTPADKIYITTGTRYTSMFCTDPNCHCYTIYAPSSSAVEGLIDKYKSKKPS